MQHSGVGESGVWRQPLAFRSEDPVGAKQGELGGCGSQFRPGDECGQGATEFVRQAASLGQQLCGPRRDSATIGFCNHHYCEIAMRWGVDRQAGRINRQRLAGCAAVGALADMGGQVGIRQVVAYELRVGVRQPH